MNMYVVWWTCMQCGLGKCETPSKPEPRGSAQQKAIALRGRFKRFHLFSSLLPYYYSCLSLPIRVCVRVCACLFCNSRIWSAGINSPMYADVYYILYVTMRYTRMNWYWSLYSDVSAHVCVCVRIERGFDFEGCCRRHAVVGAYIHAYVLYFTLIHVCIY